MSHTVISILKKVKKLITAGNLNKAELLCNKVLKKNTQQADAFHLSGLIAFRKNDYTHAIQAYEKAITIKPDKASTYSDLCQALTKSGDINAAIEAGKKAITLTPNAAIAHYNLANSYAAIDNFDASFKHYLKASQLLPRHLGIQFDLGNTYVSRGELEEARKCFGKVLKLQPNHLVAYGNLVRVTKYNSTEHEDVTKLKAFMYQTQLSDTQRATALFSLGKIYQDCKQYDEAFSYFKHGNLLLDRKYQFNPAQPAQAASLIIDNCTSNLFKQKRESANPSETPIFIVGTPRSGSTLTEQILSSHPDVFGAGELHWFPETADRLPQYLKTAALYPQCLTELTENTSNKLASKYLEHIRSLANGECRIIDKMPGNFLHLGLIHLLFPNAKIIHCQRQAKDACISMYCTQFPSGVPYSYDLYKLGVFYSQYERTMEHWKNVLPDNTIIEIEYENIVNNQETESRRLLDFLNLEWNENCLEFYKQKRSVQTASDTQIIKPIYSSSIGRWKHYQKHLQALEDGFKYK